MRPIVAISGLSVELHDRVRREKPNAFAPNGHLILKPIPREGFSTQYADAIIQEAYDYALALPEAQPLSFAMCYVKNCDADANLSSFVQRFFPFALVKELSPIAIDTALAYNRHQHNSVVNRYVESLKAEARALIKTAKIVKTKTDVRNLTPLLLPVRNFHSTNLGTMLRELFAKLGENSDPEALLSQAVTEFTRFHPRVHPPDAAQSCFTDGKLHFKSPGKSRHGFYRPKKNDGHKAECLLNARCRLGGPYAYNFHYDCTPIRGQLSAHYPNCHAAPEPPKDRHVNIAPNDFIIGR